VTEVVLILAPLFVGASLLASGRLRRLVRRGARPVRFRNPPSVETALIIVGGGFVTAAAFDSAHLGLLAQSCGFLLSAEFFIVAWLNTSVRLSEAGVMVGMRFTLWQRFSDCVWTENRKLHLITPSGKRTRLTVPDSVRDQVQRLIETSIQKP